MPYIPRLKKRQAFTYVPKETVMSDDGGTPEFPPGVLGYGVGVFPGAGEKPAGLTRTGLMTLESARREAAQHVAQARADPHAGPSGYHASCDYRAVEIRAVDGA